MRLLFILVLVSCLAVIVFTKRENLQMPLVDQTQKLSRNDLNKTQKNVLCVFGEKVSGVKHNGVVYLPPGFIGWKLTGENILVSGIKIPLNAVVEVDCEGKGEKLDEEGFNRILTLIY